MTGTNTRWIRLLLLVLAAAGLAVAVRRYRVARAARQQRWPAAPLRLAPEMPSGSPEVPSEEQIVHEGSHPHPHQHPHPHTHGEGPGRA